MPETTTAALALYLAVCAWAAYLGSHIPPERWAQYPQLIGNGIKAAVYVLWANDSPCKEDLRRLRQDAGQLGLGFEVLLLRLGWGQSARPPTPVEWLAIFRDRLVFAKGLGYKRIFLLLFNEPNLELVLRDASGAIVQTLMMPSEFLAWYKELVRLIRGDSNLAGIEIVSPPVGAYADNSWEWWDQALRECCSLSDFAGVNLYPQTDDELAGGWSLPWWQGQVGAGKQIVVCEMGARTGTPASVRLALLPLLYRQVKACTQVDMAAAFVQWTEGAEHAEHWLTPANLRALVDANAGTIAPPVPITPPAEPGMPAIPVGGTMVFRVTYERIG